jgi:hypothetical protein
MAILPYLLYLLTVFFPYIYLFKIFYHCFVDDCKNWKAGTNDQPFTTLDGAIVTLAAGFV